MRLLRQFLRLKIPFEQHYVPNVTAEICQPVSASKDSFFVFQEIQAIYIMMTVSIFEFFCSRVNITV